MTGSRLRVFDGGANYLLAKEISDYLGLPLGSREILSFADGETQVKIVESVRGTDVFVIQPTCRPVNENLMKLLIMIDAIKRASARSITAVVPYFGYARQERKNQGREPITAKLVANLLTIAGLDRVVAVDLHEGAIQGFFDIPFDHASAIPLLSEYFLAMSLGDIVVVSPDAGGTERARHFAKRLKAGLAIIDKRRSKANQSEVMNVIGEIRGKTAIIIDDMIDTAGTMIKAADALMKQGCVRVFGCATHPVFSNPALELIGASVMKEVVVMNTIPIFGDEIPQKVKALSVAPLLGELIYRIHNDISVSDLFL